MGSQVFYTILGGFISASVGAGLFFLQRYLERGDEQEKILFQVLQLMTIRSIPASGGDEFAIAAQINIADEARAQEIRSLAIRIKNQEIAAGLLAYDRMSAVDKNELIERIAELLNPELLKRIGRKY